MILKINNKKYEYYRAVDISLKYDSLASTFSFQLYHTPENPDHKALFKPLQYYPCVIEHEGEVLVTGTLLNMGTTHAPEKELATIAGYSLPGILEDCQIPASVYPLQSGGLTLKQITEKILKPFGLKLVVDDNVAAKVNKAFVISKANDRQTCKSYLTELANQRHVILTHDEKGRVLLTEAKANMEPVLHIEEGVEGVVRIELDINGQGMHSTITVQRQKTKSNPNSSQHTATNPYVTKYRPFIDRLNGGEDINTEQAAKNLLAVELKNVRLKVDLDRWKINGKMLKPNMVITVISPENSIYKKTKFFVEQVDLSGANGVENATLTCYLPEVYNGKTPKNIFE